MAFRKFDIWYISDDFKPLIEDWKQSHHNHYPDEFNSYFYILTKEERETYYKQFPKSKDYYRHNRLFGFNIGIMIMFLLCRRDRSVSLIDHIKYMNKFLDPSHDDLSTEHIQAVLNSYIEYCNNYDRYNEEWYNYVKNLN